jgi:hypothetical protein
VAGGGSAVAGSVHRAHRVLPAVRVAVPDAGRGRVVHPDARRHTGTPRSGDAGHRRLERLSRHHSAVRPAVAAAPAQPGAIRRTRDRARRPDRVVAGSRRRLPLVPVAGAVGATAGAIVADFLLARARTVLPIIAGGVPVLVWAGQLAGLAVADALRWPVSLWAGAVVLAGFTGAAVSLLAAAVSSADTTAASVSPTPQAR